MAGLLQRRRGRAAVDAQEGCFVCGHPVTAGDGAVEIDGRVFHDTCLHGPVEGRTYQQLYGERTGDVKSTVDGRRNG
ncbi:MAG: hypothetical protein M3Z33_04735 [Actinomycetota bacterium]|nr:hypothetical protein [Actinomycetota bacterium]